MQPELTRRLAAILALDIVGYSKMMGADERGTLARLLHRRKTSIDNQVAAHQGHVVKGTGDGILAEFASAQDAINAAIAIQRALADAHAAEPGEPPMIARIGINIGDILFEQGDIFGDDVNIAARLESVAPAGGVCISGRAIGELRRIGIPFEDLGELELKNIAVAVRALSVSAETIADFSVTERSVAGGRSKPVRGWSQSAPLLLMTLIVIAAIGGSLGWWLTHGGPERPVVLVEPLQVASSDQGAQLLGQSLSSDLSRMIVADDATIQIADAADPAAVSTSKATFRIVGTARTDGAALHASVRLLDQKDDNILWSSDFTRPVAESDALRQQIASRVADVLTCALGSSSDQREKAVLDTLRVYLAGCEVRHTDWSKAASYFRQATQRSPNFADAWSYYAVSLAEKANDQPEAEAPATRVEARNAALKAIALDPRAAEPYFALVITTPYMADRPVRSANLDKGLSIDPDNPELLTSQYYGLWAVGRVGDAAPFARHATELSPFSPLYAMNLAEQLAYSDQLNDARKILAQARDRWAHEPFAETSRFEIEAQVGDPVVALAILNDPASNVDYSPSSVLAWKALITFRRKTEPAEHDRAAATLISNVPTSVHSARLEYVQHLVQIGKLDEAFALAAQLPSLQTPLQGVWFRNYMAPFRRDPRFMGIAARQGLASIWVASGRWPDFCMNDQLLRYRCQDEAKQAHELVKPPAT